MKCSLLALLVFSVVSNHAELEQGVRGAPWFEMDVLKENEAHKDPNVRRAYPDVNHQLVSILEQYFTEQLIRHKANAKSSISTRAQGEGTPGRDEPGAQHRSRQFQQHQRQHENFVALRG
ncbi:uncharacterized protein LOC131889741 [Tigriopus californicus]|uniref:uncharacterized protein LOC131889741 n=1 Tax=Tigriopus californicus TaxID=6832 RepID=UPI0027DA9F84|nr:uncharacterized protein LOC131889741 [Tigriopus californicus]